MIKQLLKNLISITGYEIRKKPTESFTKFWPEPFPNPVVISEIEEEFHHLYEEAQSKTQMIDTDNALRRQRHYTLNYLLKTVNLEGGDACELGCWKGLSAYQIATHLKKQKDTIPFHIFDSFEGLSEITEVDAPVHEKQDSETVRKHFASSLENTKNNLSDFDFIQYYKGWIPEKFSEVENKVFSFVHIDVDLYQPICDSFNFFYPRLKKHGIMIFDDYGYLQFPGAKKAVDECVKNIENSLFVPLPSGQAFLVKEVYS